MSFNKFMHPRNIYRNPPDFKSLSIKYPEFRQYATQNLSGKVHIDFKDPVALRTLTTVLLNKDFGLDVEIPPNHLIPTLPQRLNYILWIEDLLKVLPSNDGDIIGIDIGTGPCCIYPLLGCKNNNWKFLATEVDTNSLEWAIKNIQKNGLHNNIQVVKVDSSTALEEVICDTNDLFDFTICNPPFFHDLNEANALKSRTPRRPNPKSKNTPSSSEKLTEGGEVEFVKKIIDDSLKLKERIRLYTTMLGKKQSFQIIKNELKKHEVIHFTTCEFCQGNTMRWGIAWTFLPNVPFQQVPVLKHQKKKLPLIYTIVENKEKFEYSIKGVLTAFKKLLDEVKISYQIVNAGKNYANLHLKAKVNTWSHQRRKRREQLHHLTTVQEKIVPFEEQTCTESEIPMQEKHKEEITQEQDSCDDISMQEEHEEEITQEEENCNDIPMDVMYNTAYTQVDDSCIASQKKRERSNSPYSSHSKRMKIDEKSEGLQTEKDYLQCSATSESTINSSKELLEEYLLWCDVSLKYEGKSIVFKMQSPDQMNREPMHQVLQLFKNNIQ